MALFFLCFEFNFQNHPKTNKQISQHSFILFSSGSIPAVSSADTALAGGNNQPSGSNRLHACTQTQRCQSPTAEMLGLFCPVFSWSFQPQSSGSYFRRIQLSQASKGWWWKKQSHVPKTQKPRKSVCCCCSALVSQERNQLQSELSIWGKCKPRGHCTKYWTLVQKSVLDSPCSKELHSWGLKETELWPKSEV